MKKTTFWKSLFLLCALVVGTSGSWAQANWSAVYTSNVTLPTSGTRASSCAVKINNTDYSGTKHGTSSSKSGSSTITVPAGTKHLHIHAGGWKGGSATLTITPNTNISGSNSISLTANDGFSSNSPFTFSGNASTSSYYKVITFKTPLEQNTQFTLSSSGERCIYWGVNAEKFPTSVTIKNGETTATSLGMTVGDDDVTLSASVVPTDYADQAVTWSSDDPSVATVTSAGVVHAVGAGEATIKATSSLSTVYAECDVTVSAATSPAAVVSETSLDFGEVAVGNTKQLTFTVTPANLEGALTIASNNAKYTVSPTSIAQDATGEQTITVTATPTALADEMDGEITISGGGLAANKTVTLSATLYQVSTVTLSATNGVIKEGGETKTSITSRVGNTVTVTAVPNDGYIFDSWSATGATPASSSNAETVFTLNEPSVTLTASFVVDPNKYTTLDDEIPSHSSSVVNYGDAAQTIIHDGLTWEFKGYQPQNYHVFQIRARTHNDGISYIKLPQFSGNIQSIACTVTGASATTKTGATTTNVLYFQTGNTGTETVVGTSNNDNSNSRLIDISSLNTKYNTGYITANSPIRIWEITVAYEPTDINVSVSGAKYATFSDHLDRNFSGTGIKVYAAQANGAKVDFTEVEDGIVPANTGVVLYSETVKNNVAIPVATTDGEFDFSDNEMIGINTRTKVAYADVSGKYNYILSNEESGVGFYKATASGAYLPAHRAYLSTTKASPARDFLAFNDETTGINALDNLTNSQIDNDAPIYNLAGQRVTKAYKGVVIQNGKKMLNK